MQNASTRQRRIGHLIQQELTMLLRDEADNPLVREAVITAVHVCGDLSFAKVYISDQCDDIQARVQACQKAARFLRHLLAQHINLRTVPELTFVADTSLTRGNQLSKLIDDVCAEDDKNRQQHDDTDDNLDQT